MTKDEGLKRFIYYLLIWLCRFKLFKLLEFGWGFRVYPALVQLEQSFDELFDLHQT